MKITIDLQSSCKLSQNTAPSSNILAVLTYGSFLESQMEKDLSQHRLPKIFSLEMPGTEVCAVSLIW